MAAWSSRLARMALRIEVEGQHAPAAPEQHFDKALLLQAEQGLAHQGARDAQALADLVFGEAVARHQAELGHAALRPHHGQRGGLEFGEVAFGAAFQQHAVVAPVVGLAHAGPSPDGGPADPSKTTRSSRWSWPSWDARAWHQT
jgi:hypothetical protein